MRLRLERMSIPLALVAGAACVVQPESAPAPLPACVEGQLLRRGAAAWECASPPDSTLRWAALTDRPDEWPGSVPLLRVTAEACSDGQYLRRGVAGWECGTLDVVAATWADVRPTVADTTEWPGGVPWSRVQGTVPADSVFPGTTEWARIHHRPADFPPSAHAHALEDVSDGASATAVAALAERVAQLETALATRPALAPGAIVPFAGTTCPAGTLPADGANRLRSEFPALFAAMGCASGCADGEHFNLPDYRGRFLRGHDAGTGRDPAAGQRGQSAGGGHSGDAVGTVQSATAYSRPPDNTAAWTTGGAFGFGAHAPTPPPAPGVDFTVSLGHSHGLEDVHPTNVAVQYCVVH